jgi:cell division protein ZapA
LAHVSVSINGRKYQIACEDGQEAHLARLAAYVDRRINELVASIGQVGDAQLLVMAGLVIADELSDAYAEVESLKAGDRTATARLDAEENLGAAMDSMAERIEGVAARLKGA